MNLNKHTSFSYYVKTSKILVCKMILNLDPSYTKLTYYL